MKTTIYLKNLINELVELKENDEVTELVLNSKATEFDGALRMARQLDLITLDEYIEIKAEKLKVTYGEEMEEDFNELWME